MSGRLAVGLRLAWAGRGSRTVAIVGGAGVATALLLATAAIPGAIYPPGVPRNQYEATNVSAVLTFSIVPAVVLLMTASRTSAATRDRRLAALRLMGVSLRGTISITAVENAVLALVGAVLGVALFLVASPVVGALVAAGPAWFAGPFTTTPFVALVTVLGVAAALVAVSTLSVRSALRSPIAARAEATVRRPSPWRLVVPAAAVAVLGLLATVGRNATWLWNDVGVWLLLLGAITGAVAIATSTPFVTAFLARWAADRGGPATLLAARAIEVDPGSTARLVSAVGVALYLVLAGVAVLGSFESTPQYLIALQSIREGPQKIDVRSALGFEQPVQTADLALLAEVEGVEAVLPHYVVGWDYAEEGSPPTVFVGTCADLSHVMSAAGCQDDRAAAIEVTRWEGTPFGWDPGGYEATTADLAAIDLSFVPNGADLRLDLGPPIEQDSGATQERWVYQSEYDLFIPPSVIEASGALPIGAAVIAEGGIEVQRRVADAAPSSLSVEPPWLGDYEAVLRVRAVITTLSALAIGVALLSVSMTAADRAIERRRGVARQVAVGIPARTLRASQLLQVVAPMAVAIVMATLLGTLMVHAYAALAGWPPLADGIRLSLVAVSTLVGALVVSIATVPIIRTRVTADLLRRE